MAFTSQTDSVCPDNLSIPEYYAGKNIFLTGATGFIGKVLIEKILRSCPKVKGIYCLIRPKRGVPSDERLEKLFEQRLYERVKEEQPDCLSKVHLIHGDMMEDGLAIKPEDQQLLAEHINIVFHSAATIRFDEPLRLAAEMNVLGVRKILNLCKKMKNLEVLVHVSTAYANCDRSHIDETVYPPPVEPQKLIDILEWMDDEMLDSITPHLLGKKPNTYTYTKHLAEILLMEEKGDLPLAIVRPSIVTAAWKEPLPGWIDNLNGPSGLVIAAGKGMMRTMKAGRETVADLIPVDLPVNTMVAVAWHTVVKKPNQTMVYQITSGGVNPITWGEQENIVMGFTKRIPFEACFRRPNCSITTNSVVHNYWLLVSHLIPAYLADMGFRLMGKKPKMVHLYTKLHKAMNTLEFFACRNWEWSNSNMDLLREIMSTEDAKNFYLDPRAIHWPTYIENYCLGTKTFILKEEESGLPAAKAHLRKLRNIRYMFNTAVLVILWRVLVAKSHLAVNSWSLVLGLVFKFVRFFKITSTMSR